MLVFRNILRTYKWKNLNFSPLFMKNRLKRCYSQVYFEPCKISMTEVLLAKANGSIINVEKVPNMSLSVLSRVKLGQYPVATSPHKHKLGRIRFWRQLFRMCLSYVGFPITSFPVLLNSLFTSVKNPVAFQIEKSPKGVRILSHQWLLHIYQSVPTFDCSRS